MPITWTDVKGIAPGDSAIQAFADPGGLFVSLAYAQMDASFWTRTATGDTSLLDLGARLLAAHMFTVGNKTGGSGGPVQDEKVGDVSRALAVLQEDAAWDSTPYGVQFRRLMRTLNVESRFNVTGGAAVRPVLPFGGSFIP